MKKLVVTASARRDLQDIARFTEARWGSEQKARYAKLLKEALSRMRADPECGPVRRDLPGDRRALVVGRHVIFYRVAGDHVIALRVLHQRMDAPAHFRD